MSSRERDEIARIRRAYARRTRTYSALEPWVCMMKQERERALVRWARQVMGGDLSNVRIVELGCGTGSNLLDFIRLGVRPENMVGNDLLEPRIAAARQLLPGSVCLISGDAAQLQLQPASFDVVFQSMMCSSILDDRHLQSVADLMWRLVRPGGGILWYDFIYNNPWNTDVRGIPLSLLRSMFPEPPQHCWRVTLAPPLSRVVSRIHPFGYTLLNVFPFLRTHVLCWIPKAADGATHGG